MTTLQASSTIAALLTDIASAIKEACDGVTLSRFAEFDRGPDVYSIVAPMVIAGYSDIDKSELGFVPGGEFGLCHGRYDATPAKSVQDTVELFMQIVKGFHWDSVRQKDNIHVDAVDLKYRCWRLGLSLAPAGYPTGTWRISAGGRSSDVLHAFADVNDPRVLYVIAELEKTGLTFKDTTALDVVASHITATYDAGMTDTGKGLFVATCATKRGH